MDSEDFFPRAALIAGVVVAVIFYSRSRGSKRLKRVQSTAVSLPKEALAGASDAAATITDRSQSILENVLDNVAETALKELKVVLRDGLKRLEKAVEEL